MGDPHRQKEKENCISVSLSFSLLAMHLKLSYDLSTELSATQRKKAVYVFTYWSPISCHNYPKKKTGGGPLLIAKKSVY